MVDDNAVAYVIGANHASTGNSVYSNVAVYDPFRNLGIVAIDDSDFIGTADVWASGTAAANDADKLFVVALARKDAGGATLQAPSEDFLHVVKRVDGHLFASHCGQRQPERLVLAVAR